MEGSSGDDRRRARRFASVIGTDKPLQHSLRGVRRSVDALGRQVAAR
jgi:hypothetical protein